MKTITTLQKETLLTHAVEAQLKTLNSSVEVRNGWSTQIDIVSVTELNKPEQTPELKVVGIVRTPNRGVESRILKGLERDLILTEALAGKNAAALYHNMMS